MRVRLQPIYLLALVLIVLASVLGYVVGIAAPSVTTTTTATETSYSTTSTTVTTTKTQMYTTTVTSTTLLIPQSSSTTATFQRTVGNNSSSTILFALSIDKPSYRLGEIMHIKGSVTNLSPTANVTLTLGEYQLYVFNSTGGEVWTSPIGFYDGLDNLRPMYTREFTLTPLETLKLDYTTADWNFTGLEVTPSVTARYTGVQVPEGTYTIKWSPLYGTDLGQLDQVTREPIDIIFTITRTANTATTITTSTTTSSNTVTKSDTPVTVCISDGNYLETEIIPVFHKIADNSSLANQMVDWSISSRQSFIDTAVKRAENLGLDSGNLHEILTKLMFHVDELNFTGRNVLTDNEGKTVEVSFRISNATVQLPCLIEKAKYKGEDAWIIALNWENNGPSQGRLGHVATVVFKYGSDEVLFASSCL